MTVILDSKEHASLQDMLHYITSDPGRPRRKTNDSEILDGISGCIHMGPEIFDLTSPVDTPGTVYRSKKTGVMTLRDVSSNFLNRLMYIPCAISDTFSVMPLLCILRHTGVNVTQQLLCSAAAHASNKTTGFQNVSGGKLSWCKLLVKSIGFPVVVDGKLASDIRGNSILDLAVPENIGYILKSVISAGVTRVTVLAETWERICTEEKRNPKFSVAIQNTTFEIVFK